ncbi:probable serine/threonine-protein kinase At1g09600 [Malania oleifera]|uniref:probable serine/threonine-protein kinase At1g09600 n=1 Tax=Malania oleifera TaxID=397392 RepID=UPI0025AE2CAC|nr:probable serine/threonine-protein kinase At1g09600 [Malania oleifera]
MGCLCSKGISVNEYVESHIREKELSKSSKRLVASSRREEIAAEGDHGGNDATARLISKQPVEENAGSTPILWDEGEKKAEVVEKATPPELCRPGTIEAGASGAQPQLSRIVSLSNGVQGAQVAAGWPSWLTAVAGEAINGWVPRKADSFEKLDKIGQGTYSSVYRGRDLETGKIVAMKKVRFVNMDPESVRFMAREILILRRLDHPNVMKLEGLVTSRVSGSLYLIFEYMEHDLAGLAAAPGIKFTEPQIKCYMQQLLRGLEHCHARGVLHRDIKGSNLLIDNNGNLKVGDFGLATFFHSSQRQPLTSRVVTLWYRPPELLLGATDYGVEVDLWSSGCILAELFCGKPIMPGRTEVEQLHKIFKLCGSPSEEYWKKSKLPHATIFKPQNPYRRCVADTFKDFPSSVLTLLDVLLAIEPESRGSASSALQSEFFRTKPLPSSPSSLPKYPPSKEFDVRLRDEEARRKKTAAGKGRDGESSRRCSRESKAAPAPDANAELQVSMQKRGQPNPKSSSEKYNPEEDGGSGFPIEPPGLQNGFSHSGQLAHPNAFGSSLGVNMNEDDTLFDSSKNDKGTQRSYKPSGATELSRFSSSVAVRGNSRETNLNSHWAPKGLLNAGYNQLDGAESSRKHDWFHRLLEGPKSSRRKHERASGKESTMGYAPKNSRIHYSGPLLPPGGNLEEMLREHEKQIQHAVRKARLDKAKTKKTYSDSGQTESLLHYGRNGR